jgi:hypothetical protein
MFSLSQEHRCADISTERCFMEKTMGGWRKAPPIMFETEEKKRMFNYRPVTAEK